MNFDQIQEVSNYIKSKIKFSPKIGVILGSGLGVFADEIEKKIVIPFEEIPGFHKTTVVGHEGRLVAGKIGNVEVFAFQGRFHAYEGHNQNNVVLPVRALAQLGAKYVILTNASGGINKDYRPGDLVSIVDHINLTGKNPLLGPNDDRIGTRFPDMSYAYDPKILELIQKSAKDLKINLHKGVYAGVLGPSYETPAEIKMLRTLGADIVGMSTVAEAIAANHAGLSVSAIACVTNMAAGMDAEKLDHKDVKEVAGKATAMFTKLLKASIEQIGKING